jgi:hypothetical protein
MNLTPIKSLPYKVRTSGTSGASINVPEAFLLRNKIKTGARVYMYLTDEGDLVVTKRRYHK